MNNERLSKRLEQSGYTTQTKWHADTQEWETIVYDQSGNFVTSDFDASRKTAKGIAMLKAMNDGV